MSPSLPPTPHVRVELSAIPAVVAWQCPQSRANLSLPLSDVSSDVTCNISLDTQRSKAIIRLRMPLQLKDLPRQKPSLFAFISPDTLESIEEKPHIPTSATQTLGTPAVGLRFKLHHPAVLVVPSAVPPEPLVPRNQAFAPVLSALQSFGQVITFTLYLPRTKLSTPTIHSICSIDWTRTAAWPPVPSPHDLTTLFSGNGARVIPAATLAARDDPASSPPSYDELALSSPPPPGPPPRKRLRARSPSSPSQSFDARIRAVVERLVGEHKEQLREEFRAQLEAVKAELVGSEFREQIVEDVKGAVREEITKEVREEEGARAQAMVEQARKDAAEEERARVRDELRREVADEVRQEERGRMQEHADALREELNRSLDRNMRELKETLVAQMDRRIDPMQEHVDNLTDAVEERLFDDAAELIDLRLDERMMGVKEELNEYVEDQIQGAEERIKHDMEEMCFSITF